MFVSETPEGVLVSPYDPALARPLKLDVYGEPGLAALPLPMGQHCWER